MKKTLTLVLFLCALPFFTIQASKNFNYSLTDSKEFDDSFLDTIKLADWSGNVGAPVLPSGSSFQINPNTGLELIANSAATSRGAYIWNRLLPTDSDWTIEVLGHVSIDQIVSQQNILSGNPFFHVGMNLFFIGNATVDPVKAFGNRFNIVLTSSSDGGNPPSLANTIFEGNYTKLSNSQEVGRTVSVTPSLPVEVTLKIHYTSANKTFSTFYRTGNSETYINSYHLDKWANSVPDLESIALTLSALSDPLNGGNQTSQPFSVPSNRLYLRDLEITVDSDKPLEEIEIILPQATPPQMVSAESPVVEKSKKKVSKGKSSSANKSSGSKKKSEAKKSGGSKKKSEGKKSGKKKKKK